MLNEYLILVLPLAAAFFAQTIKFFIRSNRQKIALKNFFAYSGMPSGHSSIVISLVTIVGLIEGIASPLFSVSVILAVVVIRDALGIRRYLGQHGKMLNVLIKDLADDHVLNQKYPHLLERIGHTPAQVIVGSLIGFLISLAGYWLLH